MIRKSIAIRVAVLAVLAGALATFSPTSASAAPCASGTTNWTGATSNDFGTESNWSNGGPSAACDAVISAAMNTPVSLSGGPFTVDDLTVSAGRELDVEPNSTLNTTTTVNAGTIRLGKAGEPLSATLLASAAAPDAIANSGTILSTGIGGISSVNFLKGNITNTGKVQVDQQLWWNADTGTLDTFTNQGTISIAPGCTASVCMYSGTGGNTFVNDAGGNITNNGGSKYLQIDSGNFIQGAGNTSVGNPQSAVVMRGNLTMTGSASTAEISGYGPSQGINASGTVGPGQTIKMPGGTLAVPTGTLVNQGTIRTVDSATSLTGNITTAGGGLLDIAAQTSHSGGTLDATNGNILVGAQLSTGTLTNHGGQITGSGPIVGNVDNVSGIVNPRNGIDSMAITGNYTQGPAATLAIEAQGVAGPQHDLLEVGGNPNLDGTLRIVPELGFFSPSNGDALKILDYSGTRSGEFSSSVADPPFTTANPVNVGYNDGDTSVFAFVGPPVISPKGVPPLLGSPIYRVILESLQPNGSFKFTKKPVVFPDGKLGLEVDTSGSCRLTAVEKTVAGAGASASASRKGKRTKKGLIKKVTIYAYGSGAHIVPLNLTAKGKKLLKKKKKAGAKASTSASAVVKDPLVITCTPVVYPVAGFTDGTQITGIGKAPTGNPPSGQPSIPSGPPTVQPGGTPVTKNPVVPLPQLPAQPPEPQEKTFKATVDLDATVGASVSFVSNGKTVRKFDASFRVVCGFPFPEGAPLETIHFDSIPATSIVGGSSTVIQGSFDIAQQSTGSPPTWITASLQGDNSNGYTVKVYERRAGCEGGTIFNARKSP